MIRRLLVLASLFLPALSVSQTTWTPASPLTGGPGEDTHAVFVTTFPWYPILPDEWLAFSRQEGVAGARTICVLRSGPSATSWPDTVIRVTHDSAANDFPSLARRYLYPDTQDLAIAWERRDADSRTYVYLSRFADSTWTTPFTIDRGGGEDHLPSLTASDSGFGVVWVRRGTIVFSEERNGTWSLPVTISPPGDTGCTRPQLYRMEYPLRWCAVWESAKPSGQEHALWSAVREAGGWSVDTLAWEGDNRRPTFYQRSYHGAVAAWETRTTGSWEIMAREGMSGAGGFEWGGSLLLSSDGDGDDREPSVQLVPIITEHGPQSMLWYTAAAWRTSQGGSDSIALSEWNGFFVTYRSPGTGCGDRHPTISGGVFNGGWTRVWTVWESDLTGVWKLYGSSIDINVAVAEEDAVPEGVTLSPAYPNPFNGATRCALRLTQRSEIRCAVIDVLGREVGVIAEGGREAGVHVVEWRADDAASGVYFLRAVAGDRVLTRKLVLQK